MLGDVIKFTLWDPCLARPEGLGGADAGWRRVMSGLEALVSVKPIAVAITKMPEWIPMDAKPQTLELTSLLGPLLRLGVFGKEWVRMHECCVIHSLGH